MLHELAATNAPTAAVYVNWWAKALSSALTAASSYLFHKTRPRRWLHLYRRFQLLMTSGLLYRSNCERHSSHRSANNVLKKEQPNATDYRCRRVFGQHR